MSDGTGEECLLTTSELITALASSPYSSKAANMVGKLDSVYSYDWKGVLIKQARIHGALQRVVPLSLRAGILYMSYYPVLAGHRGNSRLYDSLRHDNYWCHMNNDAYTTVVDCQSCAMQSLRACHQKLLRLFVAIEPLEFLTMDILGPPKTKSVN